MIVKKITKINKALYVIECPKCNTILASSSEKEFLPEFAECDCDELHYKDDK